MRTGRHPTLAPAAHTPARAVEAAGHLPNFPAPARQGRQHGPPPPPGRPLVAAPPHPSLAAAVLSRLQRRAVRRAKRGRGGPVRRQGLVPSPPRGSKVFPLVFVLGGLPPPCAAPVQRRPPRPVQRVGRPALHPARHRGLASPWSSFSRLGPGPCRWRRARRGCGPLGSAALRASAHHCALAGPTPRPLGSASGQRQSRARASTVRSRAACPGGPGPGCQVRAPGPAPRHGPAPTSEHPSWVRGKSPGNLQTYPSPRPPAAQKPLANKPEEEYRSQPVIKPHKAQTTATLPRPTTQFRDSAT